MGSNTRYDRFRPVGDREAAEARAMYMIAELVKDYPGISSSDVAGQVAHVLYAASNELRNGRALPIEVRRAVLGLTDALRREMQRKDLRR